MKNKSNISHACKFAFVFSLHLANIFPHSGLNASELASPSQEMQKQAQDFVLNTGNQIIQILIKKNVPLSERQEQFRQVLKTNFDVPAIARHVFRRHWRALNENQRQKFLALFEDKLVNTYSAQFDNYDNEKLQVSSARDNGKGGCLVLSQILRPRTNEPLDVRWQIFSTAKGLKIYDIIIGGVSMSNTQATLYSNMFSSCGQNVDAFLEKMAHSQE